MNVANSPKFAVSEHGTDADANRPAVLSREEFTKAWTILEAVHVSLADMGRFCESEEEVRDALRHYFSPEMVWHIGKARRALADYITDDEAEALESVIPYWSRQTPDPAAALDGGRPAADEDERNELSAE